MDWAYIPVIVGALLWGRFIWKYRGWVYRPKPIKEPEPIEPPQYDYMLDNGCLWTGPGDTAFWNAPSTCDELAAWCNEYRRTDYGVHDAGNNVRIEWVEPAYSAKYGVVAGLYRHQLQNAYQLQNPYMLNGLHNARTR